MSMFRSFLEKLREVETDRREQTAERERLETEERMRLLSAAPRSREDAIDLAMERAMRRNREGAERAQRLHHARVSAHLDSAPTVGEVRDVYGVGVYDAFNAWSRRQSSEMANMMEMMREDLDRSFGVDYASPSAPDLDGTPGSVPLADLMQDFTRVEGEQIQSRVAMFL